MWYALISEFLQRLRFTKTDADYSVFVSQDKSTFISVYVDDLLIIGEDFNIINGFKNKLSERFRMIDFGSVSHYLGISVTQTEESVSLDQKSYFEKVLFDLEWIYEILEFPTLCCPP